MDHCVTEEEPFVERSLLFASQNTWLETVVEEDEVESLGDSTEDNASGHGINRSVDLGRRENIVHVERDPNGLAQTWCYAIEEVFPDVTHRWCKWHVMKKAKESLGVHYHKKSEFRIEFHKLVQDMITVQEFEDSWHALVKKHGLEKNTFLIQIFEVRHKWAKPYFAGKFCAKQTSTQRSESANHMLKNYIPPGCPMNLFVKQYHKLLFDRDQEEGFQEKRTRLVIAKIIIVQGGAVLKVNIPLEKHASRIYTRTMFEMFGSFLFASGSYTVEELIPKKKYVATHLNASKREKYLKSVFEIEVSEDGDYFTCECGLFEHMGMVCCHIIKVMCELRLSEIPKKHVMKRWTLDARDILPDHLKHYQKDIGLNETHTFRHSKMYIAALELVKMGDMNVAAYEAVMKCLIDAKLKVTPLCDKTDGMSIVEKAATMAKSNGTSAVRANSNGGSTVRANSNGGSTVVKLRAKNSFVLFLEKNEKHGAAISWQSHAHLVVLPPVASTWTDQRIDFGVPGVQASLSH
ncbi:protein FAR1-RELATED SEQUENCE 5-like [Lolium perenne]|uniref:protein FAR1-RELATED SEQUENCE 5-like n=1 Tax=Lolium perenne TaxID=4522 RepID=UPI003A9A1C52